MTETDDTRQPDATAKAARDAARWVVRLSERPGLAQARRFRRWYARPGHAAAFDRAQRAWGLGGIAGAGLPVHPPVPRQDRRATGLIAGAVAACLALVLIGGLLLRPDVLTGWRADHAAPRGETRLVTLQDGTEVLLDAGSALDIVGMGSERIVRLLQGQAYFDVTSTGAPFTVQAGGAQVRVLGTRFDVRLVADSTEVMLEEGAVAVSRPGSDGRQLTPGHRIRTGPDSQGAPEAVSLDDAIAWRSGRYVFYDRPLAEVIEVLERHGPGRLMLTGANLPHRPVSGSILLKDSGAALQALATTSGFRIVQLPAGIKLLVE